MLETVAPDSPPVIALRSRTQRLRIVLLGGFGLQPKATMSARALPIGHELVARGHEVTLIVPPWDNPTDAGKQWDDHGVRVINVALASPLHMPRIVAALSAAVRAARPDLVHLFKPKGYAGLVAPLLRGIPIILDTDDWEGTGGWNSRGSYSVAQQRLFGWQERTIPRHAAHVTVASRTLETQQWGFGIAPERVTYLPNALSTIRYAGWRDTEATREESARIRVQRGLMGPTVLLYTRFHDFVPEYVAAAFARVRRAVPQARLLIVGGALHSEESAARVAFAQFGDAVERAGFLPFANLPAHLLAADVAIVPLADTLINRARSSVKTLELLALGQTVVATAVGENTSVIRQNETGCIAPPNDAGALAEAVLDLLHDADRAKALGTNAHDYAWHAQTWTAQIETLRAIYARVASRSTVR